MPSKPEKNALSLNEWISFCIIFGFIVSLIIIEVVSYPGSSSQRSYIAPLKKIEITLVGAIKQPGVYYFEPGVTLGQVLKKKKLLPQADRKKLSSKKILLCSQTIEIPCRSE